MDEEITSKSCYRCSQTKPISQFQKATGYSRDGYTLSCEDCVKEHLPWLFRDDGSRMSYNTYREEFILPVLAAKKEAARKQREKERTDEAV